MTDQNSKLVRTISEAVSRAVEDAIAAGAPQLQVSRYSQPQQYTYIRLQVFSFWQT